MNKQTEILVIGRDESILQTVIRLVNNNPEWIGTGAATAEDAIEKFHHHHFDVVLLTNGIGDEEEKKLRKIFIHQDTDIIIIQHYGGGSGLLQSEIREALDKRKAANKPTVSFTDDALKNAGLHINIQ
jgi:DNA-binding NtrC family response regulator